MSDDEADAELVALLRQHLAGKLGADSGDADTGVLAGAEAVYDDAIDVAIDMRATKRAAAAVREQMMRRRDRSTSLTAAWNEHELHPDPGEWDDGKTLDFVFAVDLLNFCFWSELPEDERFAVEYRGRRWTGYWSLVAALRRALEEGWPVTDPGFWCCGWEDEGEGEGEGEGEAGAGGEGGVDGGGRGEDENAKEEKEKQEFDMNGNVIGGGEKGPGTRGSEDEITPKSPASNGVEEADGDAKYNRKPEDTTQRNGNGNGSINNPAITPGKAPVLTLATLRHIFRSATAEEMPLLPSRLAVLREAGAVLRSKHSGSVASLVLSASGSAAQLVNTLARDFPSFRDEHRFDGLAKPVRFLKRAQIFVADIWACFDGEGYGAFDDMDCITIFADYRVPQMLGIMGCLSYAPALAAAVDSGREIESGSRWEVQIRGCSIWCVELIRRQMVKDHPGDEGTINAVLIDFFLYDTVKQLEGTEGETVKHHRTRSVWY